MQQKKNKKSGFTLVELVVVVAIIGVLAAIAVPRVRTALSRSKDAAALANIETLRTASNVYFAEKGKPAGITIETAITELKAAGYLDSKWTNTNGIFAVGTTACTVTDKPDLDGKTVAIALEADKVGIVIDSTVDATTGVITKGTLLDTNCSPWSGK